MSTNLPISGLNEQKFDINLIKTNYDDIDEAFDVDERLMYFAVAYLNGSNYVSRKIGWLNLMQSYMFSQQFAVDIAEIIHRNDIIEQYKFFYDNQQLIPDADNNITIPKPDLTNYYTKNDVDSLIESKYNEINNRIDEILEIRQTVDVIIPSNKYVGGIYECEVPINFNVLGANLPNVKLYEKRLVNSEGKIYDFSDLTIDRDSYNIESFVEVLIHKEIKTNTNNQLKIKLFFENTNAFEGKLIIN